MIQAKKFTFQYDRVEDRLKMLVNYDSADSRIDFFITRAMLFRLIPVIEQILIKAETNALKEAPKVHRKNIHVNSKGIRLAPEQKTDTSTMKLLDQKHIFLLSKVDFQFNSKNNSITMILSAQNEPKCSAKLTSENFSQVMNAMIGAVPHTSWGMASNILEI